MREGRKELEGLRVVSFESRRSEELAQLIRSHGGEPIRAPALQEVPLTQQAEALAFGENLMAGECDVLILLTGGGTDRAGGGPPRRARTPCPAHPGLCMATSRRYRTLEEGHPAGSRRRDRRRRLHHRYPGRSSLPGGGYGEPGRCASRGIAPRYPGGLHRPNDE